jgi:MFS family permease
MATNVKILKNRNLQIIGLSMFVSGIGSWIAMMAVMAMIVFEGEGGVKESSGLFLAGLLPTLLCSPIAGWFSDRFNRKWIMVISQALCAIAIGGLIFTEDYYLIALFMGLEAAFLSLLNPARQASIPDIVEDQDLVKANAFFQQLNGVVKIFSPMMAGALLTVMNPHQAIIFNVFSYLASAILLTRLTNLPPAKINTRAVNNEEKPQEQQVLGVFRDIPELICLFVLGFVGLVIFMGYDVLASIFVRDVLHQSEQFYGLMIGMIGVGTFAATFIFFFRKQEGDPWKDITIAVLMFTVMLVGFVAVPKMDNAKWVNVLILGSCLFGGLGSGLQFVQRGTLLQRLPPKQFLGRIMGLNESVLIAGQLTGVLVTPLLVPGVISINGYFQAAGGLMIAMFVFLSFSIRWFNQNNTPVDAMPEKVELG